MTFQSLLILIGLAALGMGCSTAYRSEVSYRPVGTGKYNLAVKVLKVERSALGTKEIPVYAAPSQIWEHGKPQSSTATIGEEGSVIIIESFVSKVDDGNAAFTVLVKKKGDVVYESKFVIKQPK